MFYDVLSMMFYDVLCVKSIFGFLLSERTSGVSPVIFSLNWPTSGGEFCKVVQKQIYLVQGVAANGAHQILALGMFKEKQVFLPDLMFKVRNQIGKSLQPTGEAPDVSCNPLLPLSAINFSYEYSKGNMLPHIHCHID